METLILKQNLIGQPSVEIRKSILVNSSGWLPAPYLEMNRRILKWTGHGKVRMVTYQKYDNVTLSPVTQAPTTPCLALPPPPCPRQRRQG